jgi:hypothetical protein
MEAGPDTSIRNLVVKGHHVGKAVRDWTTLLLRLKHNSVDRDVNKLTSRRLVLARLRNGDTWH